MTSNNYLKISKNKCFTHEGDALRFWCPGTYSKTKNKVFVSNFFLLYLLMNFREFKVSEFSVRRRFYLKGFDLF